MSTEAEVKKLVAFKKKLEKRVGKLKCELEEMQTFLEVVNSILLEKGFKRAKITKAPPTAGLPKLEENLLKTVKGEVLANYNVDQYSLRVVLAEDKNFNAATPPFTQFLVERVLDRMQKKDSELAGAGKLASDKVFSYDIVSEGDRVREIVIRNFGAKRLKELKSSIRWTLEKMYEKMKTAV